MENAIKSVQQTVEFHGTSDITILKLMGVCPVPLFDAFTLEAFRLHQMVSGGAPWPWTGGFYDQPAVFARAQEVIAQEQSIIRKEDQRREHGRKQTI